MKAESIIFGRLNKPDAKFVRADTGEFVCWYRESETEWTDPAGKKHRFILRFTIVPGPEESTMAVFEAVGDKWVNVSERRQIWRQDGLLQPLKETARLDLDDNAIYCPVEIPEWGKFDEWHAGDFQWNGAITGDYIWDLRWEKWADHLRCDDVYADSGDRFHRIEHFDSQGMCGFIDETAVNWSGVVVREDLRK